jgi:hypothetical protein
MKRNVVALMVLGTLLAFPTFAQVKARQGDPAKDEEATRFHSPMILEIPLSVAARSLWNQGAVKTDGEVGMKKYTCDGVSFADFSVSADKARDHNVKITFHSSLANEPGVDKRVTLRFELVREDAVLANVAARGISVEEGKQAPNESSVLLSETTLTEGAVPLLRVTMSVTDDR